VLHPVGPLSAAVYWRRRLLVLTLLAAMLGGGGWVSWAAATGRFAGGTGTAGAAAATPPAEPALERVVPSLASVQIPHAAACTDDMIRLAVRTPGSGPVGGGSTFELLVTNLAAVPCGRALDEGLRDVQLFDGAGNRLWDSNDCSPGTGTDLRTLAPGEVVDLPVQWGGLTSAPTCTAARVPVAAGSYVVRARLGTGVAPDAPFTIV
jgi:hypothetical protein